MGTQIIPTGLSGPAPPQTIGLILGKGGWIVKGLQVYPGLIDENYTEEIKVMVSAPRGIITINEGEVIAQLLLLPISITQEQGRKAPDIFWVKQITREKPNLNLVIEGKVFKGLLDTGADVSVISKKHWPQHWALDSTSTTLQGLGIAQAPSRSAKCLVWEDPEGNKGNFQPYVVDHLPVNLWGRDVLQGLGAMLCSPNEIVTNILLKQGYIGQGLGKNPESPRQEVLQPKPRISRLGLGHPF